ncbi:hypothetical protein GQ607_013147 [Colletotrichum asianum]|uniref:Heterokaryon incompatibility domain-containing protein n=1 Tax=Colletotrichum asianum TaxID=702518 RepID=A0A8H3W7M0_9PEZI|nr:hypothetical protein GQ607_013147 [Colletotrichum asianum]
MDSFTHEPLDLSQPSIRHLCLLKGDYGPIHCLIYQDRLGDTAIPYEALSYVWGSSELTHAITINGKRMRITQNLFHALRQQNHRERGHQVQQMSQIYRRAERVLFWLGDGTTDTDALISMLQKLKDKMEGPGGLYNVWVPMDQHELVNEWIARWLIDCKTMAGHVIPPSSLHKKSLVCGLQLLLERSWFKRVWILQEVTNAQAAFICCGKMSVSAMYFAQSPSFIEASPDAHCQAVLDIMPGPSRIVSWSNQRLNLFSLLKRFGTSEATDPRDIIFALRGIPKKSAHLSFPDVNYDITEAGLARKAFKSMFAIGIPSRAMLNTINDLVTQLDRFLAADILYSPSTAPRRHLEIRITERILRTMINSCGERTITVAPNLWRCADQAAVLHAYRSAHLELATFLFSIKEESIPWHRLVYSALQNSTGQGVELIDSFCESGGLGKEQTSIATQMLYQLFPLWFKRRPNNAEPIEESFDSSCVFADGLTALLDQLIKSGRKAPVDASWRDSNRSSLLYMAVKSGKVRVFRRLFSCDPAGLTRFEINRLRQKGAFAGRGTSAHQSAVAQMIATLLQNGLNNPGDFPATSGNADLHAVLSECPSLDERRMCRKLIRVG